MEVPIRPHTSANTGPPVRAVSQPLATPQQFQPPPPPPPKAANAPEGVWADLVSLQTPSSSLSLPLQYQVTPQQPSFIGGVTTFQTGMGVNPLQQQQTASNPFFQPQFMSSPGIAQTTFTGLPHQPYLINQSPAQPPISAPIQMQPPFFQPRPQQGNLQIQRPAGGHPSFASPVAPGAFTAAPASQGQFLSSSPAMQYPTYSPQAQLPMMSSTPQLQMQMHQPGQFVSHSPHLIMTGTPHPTTPHPTTPHAHMQMQQGSFMATTPQTGQFAGLQGQGQGQATPGGFAGQQWSAL
jgi:stromal membrane-associated protein